MTTLQATEQAINIGQLIVASPGIRQGRPRIAGTGVTVQSIVGLFRLGLSPEKIADEFGHLWLAQVYAGLAYYHANREQLEAAIEADHMEAERLEQEPMGGRRLAAWAFIQAEVLVYLLRPLPVERELQLAWMNQDLWYQYGTLNCNYPGPPLPPSGATSASPSRRSKDSKMALQQKLNVDQVVKAIALLNQADLQELRRRLPPVLGKYRVGLEPSEDTSLSLWQAIKDQIAEETPDLLQMSPEARRAQFDRLSEKIASELSYDSVEAFEQTMRGDTYGLARH